MVTVSDGWPTPCVVDSGRRAFVKGALRGSCGPFVDGPARAAGDLGGAEGEGLDFEEYFGGGRVTVRRK